MKRKTQISADLLENFRRAGRVCLWVLIIYEAKRCLFCLRTFGRLSLFVRCPVPSPSLSTRMKKNYSRLKCALNSPRWSSGKFYNFKLTFVGFFKTRTQRSLKICDIFDRFFDDFDLKKHKNITSYLLEFFLSLSRRQSVTCYKVSYLRHTRPRCCRWNK